MFKIKRVLKKIKRYIHLTNINTQIFNIPLTLKMRKSHLKKNLFSLKVIYTSPII